MRSWGINLPWLRIFLIMDDEISENDLIADEIKHILMSAGYSHSAAMLQVSEITKLIYSEAYDKGFNQGVKITKNGISKNT